MEGPKKDWKTIAYYNQFGEEFCQRTLDADMSYNQNKFLKYLQPGMKILDAGCGSGRDSRYFLQQGFLVDSIDASQTMCDYAGKVTGQQVQCIPFEEIDFFEKFHGIWACASLLHVRKQNLPSVLRRLSKSLIKSGILYTSFKYGQGERETPDRYFNDMNEAKIRELFNENNDLEILDCYITQDVREELKDQKWINVISRKKRS